MEVEVGVGGEEFDKSESGDRGGAGIQLLDVEEGER